MNEPVSKVRSIALFLSLYGLTFALLLVHQGLYGDSWRYLFTSTSAHMADTANYGYPWMGPVYTFFQTLSQPILVSSWITFFSFAVAGLATLGILRQTRGVGPYEAFWISLFFSILPYNSARVILSLLQYSIPYTLFWVAWFALAKHQNSGRLWLRLAALALFALSFTANSLLVFYLLPLGWILYQTQTSFKTSLQIAFRYVDFLLLPVVFWVARCLYFHPLLPQYNDITLSRVLFSPFQIATSLYHVVIEVSDHALSSVSLLSLCGLGLVLYLALSKFLSHPSEIPSKAFVKKALWASLFALVLACLPYTLVNKLITGNFNEFEETRHQLLVPFGMALGWVYIVYAFIQNPAHRLKVFCAVTALCLLTQWHLFAALELDAAKQAGLLFHLKQLHLPSDSLIVFSDQTRSLNVHTRSVQPMEYEAYLSQALGPQSWTVITPDKIVSEAVYDSQSPSENIITISVVPHWRAYNLRPESYFNYKIEHLFFPEKFIRRASELVRLQVQR